MRITYSRAALRALSERLPEAVAAACYAFITGDLATSPRRVGTPLRPPLAPAWRARRGAYRVIYEIREDHVHIVDIQHRRDAYHS